VRATALSRRIGEDTACVLQEVALRIFRTVARLREPKLVKAWAFRIATRVSLVHLKREKRWREIEESCAFSGSFSSAAMPEVGELDSFWGLLDRVSPASRAVLLLHYQQHLSLEETAAILDIPLGTAKSRLAYGIASIRNSLKEKDGK
jgi:RNA polymerase sigma-70 factor (ECF subfamily)